MALVREGLACHGPDLDGQSSFVHRERWLPDLDWSPPSTDEAVPELARRYLATYGPAEARDLAFWYGTTGSRHHRFSRDAAGRSRSLEVLSDNPDPP